MRCCALEICTSTPASAAAIVERKEAARTHANARRRILLYSVPEPQPVCAASAWAHAEAPAVRKAPSAIRVNARREASLSPSSQPSALARDMPLAAGIPSVHALCRFKRPVDIRTFVLGAELHLVYKMVVPLAE